MKKIALCVIAHPDDEAFGPSGTLAKLAKTYDVHIACVTDGQSDPRFHKHPGKQLAVQRAAELQKSAALLGVKEVHFLHFQDGSLSNNVYHDVAAELDALCETLQPSFFVTNDLRGNSGHLDHVAVAMVTSFVYRKRKSVQGIMYNCVSREVSDEMQDYFVYFPHGYAQKDVDLVVDVSGVFEQKLEAARCHQTQIADVERVTARWITDPKKEEWFLVESRSAEWATELKKNLA